MDAIFLSAGVSGGLSSHAEGPKKRPSAQQARAEQQQVQANSNPQEQACMYHVQFVSSMMAHECRGACSSSGGGGACQCSFCCPGCTAAKLSYMDDATDQGKGGCWTTDHAKAAVRK